MMSTIIAARKATNAANRKRPQQTITIVCLERVDADRF